MQWNAMQPVREVTAQSERELEALVNILQVVAKQFEEMMMRKGMRRKGMQSPLHIFSLRNRTFQ
jgi:hypothetical protein